MRLLQVAVIPETLEAFLLPFASHFRNLGWQVDGAAAAITANSACAAAFDGLHDVPWTRNPLRLNAPRAVSGIRDAVRDGGYDVVHVHTPIASFLTRYALRNSPQRPVVVYTAHGFHFHQGGHPVKNFVYRTAEKIAGPWTDRLVTINREDYGAATDCGIVPAERLEFVPGIGLDLQALKAAASAGPDRSEVRSGLGIPADAPLFLMVAEFTPNKRHQDVLAAFAATDVPGSHLVLAGMGETEPDVREQARRLGVQERTHFLGYRRDVPSLMNAADALLLVSQREGLPRSIMEAMTLGVPVIGTKIRGVADLLAGGAGMLVDVGDVAAIRGALEQLATPGALRGELAQRAASRVNAYALPNVLSEYERIYAEALASAGR